MKSLILTLALLAGSVTAQAATHVGTGFQIKSDADNLSLSGNVLTFNVNQSFAGSNDNFFKEIAQPSYDLIVDHGWKIDGIKVTLNGRYELSLLGGSPATTDNFARIVAVASGFFYYFPFVEYASQTDFSTTNTVSGDILDISTYWMKPDEVLIGTTTWNPYFLVEYGSKNSLVSVNYDTVNVEFIASMVPEPKTGSLLMAGLLLGIMAQRRLRKTI